jgi:hypothetical protein
MFFLPDICQVPEASEYCNMCRFCMTWYLILENFCFVGQSPSKCRSDLALLAAHNLGASPSNSLHETWR